MASIACPCFPRPDADIAAALSRGRGPMALFLGLVLVIVEEDAPGGPVQIVILT